MSNSPVTFQLAAVVAHSLRQKAAAVEAAARAEGPAEALLALSQALGADPLIELTELCERLAEGLPLYTGSSVSALAGFGAEADALRALLAVHEAAAAE